MKNKFFSFIIYTFLLIGTFTSTPLPTIDAAVANATLAPSPTQRFTNYHSKYYIDQTLRSYGADKTDFTIFETLIKKENQAFIGYHASSTDFRIFQDMIKFSVEELLGTSLRDDFHFFRNPLDKNLIYKTPQEFYKAIPIPQAGLDDQPHIRQHILSLNISLFQSYDKPWDLSPRYYLENKTWTYPAYIQLLQNFFSDIGFDANEVPRIYLKAKNSLGLGRGMIYQFFISDDDYNFLDNTFYCAKSGGELYHGWKPSQVIADLNKYTFPQLRMVLNAATTLNPFGKIIMNRYDRVPKKQKENYEAILRSEIGKLKKNSSKGIDAKDRLLKLWSES